MLLSIKICSTASVLRIREVKTIISRSICLTAPVSFILLWDKQYNIDRHCKSIQAPIALLRLRFLQIISHRWNIPGNAEGAILQTATILQDNVDTASLQAQQ
jgi:hypothetical protein